MTKKSYEIDMCNGPLLSKILLFSIPLMLSGILQLLFNAADVIVVGRYAGKQALAAVGSTTSLICLLTNIFIGLSVGSNAVAARYYGQKKDTEVSKTLHTAIALSIICGISLCFIGILLAKFILIKMGSPEDVLNLSTLYLRIFFLGMPALMIYNFGASILRAMGDTQRPLYYLVLAGIINVVLNLFFVIVLNLSVAGVALATIISESISAFLIIRCLTKTEGSCHLDLKKIKIHRSNLLKIVQIGIPAGIQGAFFSISNVLIQSSINSFGSAVMAGNTAAASIEGFADVSMMSLQQSAMNFTSQNYGAGKLERIRNILFICIGLSIFVGIIITGGTFLFGDKLLGIYSSDPHVIKIGLTRMYIVCGTYFLCGIMDVLVGSLRGMGHALLPMVVSMLGACIFRIIWLETFFAWNPTLETLYYSYPISWILTAAAHIVCFIYAYNKITGHFKNKKYSVARA